MLLRKLRAYQSAVSNLRQLSEKGLIGDVPVMLAKPQTFMNASGESVSETTPLQLQNQLFSLVLLFTAVYVGRTAGFILQDTTQSISCDLR